jgi:hypothetical protein
LDDLKMQQKVIQYLFIGSFWQIAEIKWIEREIQSTGTFIKRQKVSTCYNPKRRK